MSKPAHWAIVPAAGIGSRMGGKHPKQYLPLAGKTVIEHTLARLASVQAINGIVVAISAGDSYWESIVLPANKPVITVPGGAERHHSVLNALRKLGETADPEDWVLVHDAARPCVRSADIDTLITELAGHPVGGLLGVPVSDTIKKVDDERLVIETVERRGLWRALTPQMFRLATLREAIENALRQGHSITDDAGAIELQGQRPRMIAGHADNIKITTPQDLRMAETLLRQP